MKTNILFIANGSLTNPILLTQGLPYLYSLDDSVYSVHFVSFERKNIINKTKLRIEEIKGKFGDRIKFHIVKVGGNNLVSIRIWSLLKGLKTIKYIVHRFDIKILHARNFFSAFLAVIIKTLLKPNLKILYDSRGLAVEERIFSGQLKSFPGRIVKGIEKMVVKKSDAIVVVSDRLNEYMHLRHGKLLNGKVTVINNKTTIPSLKGFELKKLKPTDEYIGVYCGSVASWQNIDGMFELFRVGLYKFNNIRFKVITWQKEIFESRLSADLELFGKIDVISEEQHKVFDHLIKCNFGIIFRENNLISNVSSPLKFAEYLVAGLPVLVNEGIGDAEKIISKYKVGSIIKGKDYYLGLQNMTNLLNDEEIYSKCRKIGEAEFDIRDSFASYTKVYEKLMS